MNTPVQKQTQNPIIQGFKLVLSKLLIAKSCTSMLLGDYSLDVVGDLAYGLLGTSAKSLFSQKWEEGWEKPLTQWQAQLNIQPIQKSNNH
ncbi:hypothetical protein [Rippkaea orientalis]|uniref:hypothetical protein n=1 Tax=Rippkaea orientalis TaxID=2546366 RepID=UPI001F4C1265|nr:hypothetical protein [Rippkaea orientalis]